MRIFINGRFLSQPMAGVQRYAFELVKALDEWVGGEGKNAGISFIILIPKNARPETSFKNIPLGIIGKLSGHLWEQLELPFYCRKDILFNPCNLAPISKLRQVTTIHDASVWATPKAYSTAFVFLYRFIYFFLEYGKSPAITDSEFSKQELVRFHGIAPNKISVVYLGAEHIKNAKPEPDILSASGLAGKPFVLSVGSLNPNKNFSAIVEMAKILEEKGEKITVAVAGGTYPRVFRGAASEWPMTIKRLGRITDGQLRALYEAATCFLFPSFYEGFGLPPLEAMSCACPVIVSQAASLPEVCADAALYCDPRDPSSMAELVRRLIHDPHLRSAMVTKGLLRSKNFTWKRCALETLEVLRK